MGDLCSTSQRSALLFSAQETFSLPLGFPPVGHWRRMCSPEGFAIGLFCLVLLPGRFGRTVGDVFVATGAARDQSVNEMKTGKLLRANIAADSMSVHFHKVLAKARQWRIESIVRERKSSLRLTLCICKMCIL